jgi:NTP pyrophosphatase (non-canonical NTP hydrolase)
MTITKKEVYDNITVTKAVDLLIDHCHHSAYNNGWWHDIKTGEEITERNISELLCLVHSEVSEAFEGYRRNKNDDHLPHRAMLDVELADTVIRIFDMAGGLKIDLAGALVEKINYNNSRADHKRENRVKDDGKKI